MVPSRAVANRAPEGFRDMLFAEAAALRGLEGRLAGLFTARGYREVAPPTVEYLEAVALGAGARAQEELYKFIDRHGYVLSLRADLTTPVARLVATHFGPKGPALRLWYAGQAFRYEPVGRGRPHEFRQAGVELIGPPQPGETPAADAEVVGLALAALEEAGLRGCTLALGHVGVLEGFWDGAGLREEQREPLRQALARRDQVAYEEAVHSLGLAPATAADLVALVREAPHEPSRHLESLAGRTHDRRALASLEHLRGVLERVSPPAAAGSLRVDLALIRDFGYYTGIVFEGFAPGAGSPVLGGGRYDGLLEKFGASRPAVGFALTIDAVLAALERRPS